MSQQINLYEMRLRPRRELASARNLALTVLVVLAVTTGTAFWAGHVARTSGISAATLQKQVAEQQERLVALSRAVAERKASPALMAELDQDKAALAVRGEVLQALASGQHGNTSGFSGFMKGFARQTQADLWLTAFQIERGGDAIEIRGRLLDPTGLPAYVQRLGSEPVFQGRRFSGLDMRDGEVNEGTPEQAAATSAQGAQATESARSLRLVEFVLRAQPFDGKADAGQGGRRP